MRGVGAALSSPFRVVFGGAWRATFGTRRSMSIVITLMIVAFAVGFASNYWLPQRLGYTLLFGLLLAALWTWSSGQGVRVRMSRSRDRVQAGESIIERFEVINDSAIPKLWLEVAETSDLPGHTAQFVTSLGRLSHRNWRVQTQCDRRGLYNLGPITVRSSDPFDIFIARCASGIGGGWSSIRGRWSCRATRRRRRTCRARGDSGVGRIT